MLLLFFLFMKGVEVLFPQIGSNSNISSNRDWKMKETHNIHLDIGIWGVIKPPPF